MKTLLVLLMLSNPLWAKTVKFAPNDLGAYLSETKDPDAKLESGVLYHSQGIQIVGKLDKGYLFTYKYPNDFAKYKIAILVTNKKFTENEQLCAWVQYSKEMAYKGGNGFDQEMSIFKLYEGTPPKPVGCVFGKAP